jgi:outer membrane receptor for ferrienterochelin and colicin
MQKFLFLGLLSLFLTEVSSQKVDTLRNYNLKEVQVSATRTNTQLKNIPQKVEIISGEVLETLPASNMADILKNTTNLDIIQYPGLASTIGMRGFSPSAHSRSYTLILLDGLPLGTTNISSIDKNIVDRIEIVKGPYSTLYGSDAMGGVINIITKSPSQSKGGNASVTTGSLGNLKLSGNANGSLGTNSAL